MSDLKKIGIVDDTFRFTTVEQLVADGVLHRPMDGNHGEQHPKVADYVSEGIPFIMANDLVQGRINYDDCNFITKKQADGLRKGFAKPGDVLVTHKATIGRTALVGDEANPYIMLTPQVTYYRIRNPEVLDKRYLRHYFDSSLFQQTLSMWAGAGATRAYLGITGQGKLPVVIPPISKQRKIAAILTAYDDLIEVNKRRTALLEKMAEELYREWFVRLRFPGYQDTRFVKGMPKGAKVSPLREHIKHYIGGGWGADSPEGRENQPVYVIRGTDFDAVAVGDVTSVPLRYEKFSSVESRKLQPGDIVMENSVNHASRTSGKSILITEGILKLFDGDVICASFCKLLRPANREFAKLLHLNFKMIFEQGLFEIYQNVATNGIANLQIERFLDRHQIVVPANIDLAKINCLDVSVIARMQARLRATRDLLLPRLMSGKLSVEDLDIQFPPSMQEATAEQESLPEARRA